MNLADAVARYAACPEAPATLLERCPWCGLALDGSVFASFLDGKLCALTQTKRIGRSDYTWAHSAAGCCVPSLRRVRPYVPPPVNGSQQKQCTV